MSWKDQHWLDLLYKKGVGRYELCDLMFDTPLLFDKIFRQAIEVIGHYDFDPDRVLARENELAAINAAQRSVFGGQNIAAKTNRYDYERLKIKNDLTWSGISPSDTVEVVFWQDYYDRLVSFAKRTKCLTVMQLLDVQYEDLKEEGFGFDLIARIAAILCEWAEKLLNPDVSEFTDMQPQKPLIEIDSSEDMASDLLSMFYANDDKEE